MCSSVFLGTKEQDNTLSIGLGRGGQILEGDCRFYLSLRELYSGLWEET